MKIQIIGGKNCLRCKGKTFLGIVNKLFVFKSLLTTTNNGLPLHLKQTFPTIRWKWLDWIQAIILNLFYFTSFTSGGFTGVNPTERNLVNLTSVHWSKIILNFFHISYPNYEGSRLQLPGGLCQGNFSCKCQNDLFISLIRKCSCSQADLSFCHRKN